MSEASNDAGSYYEEDSGNMDEDDQVIQQGLW